MARYLVEHHDIQVIGPIWMPATTGAMHYTLSGYDLENMREEGSDEITREDIAQWLTMHSGDFQGIDDFRASIGDTEYPWEQEASEWVFQDSMWPAED